MRLVLAEIGGAVESGFDRIERGREQASVVACRDPSGGLSREEAIRQYAELDVPARTKSSCQLSRTQGAEVTGKAH